MAWEVEAVDGCAVVRMNTSKVNVQNDEFFADLHGAFDRLERDYNELPLVLTGGNEGQRHRHPRRDTVGLRL
jgi:enoyl-CoA hydratase